MNRLVAASAALLLAVLAVAGAQGQKAANLPAPVGDSSAPASQGALTVLSRAMAGRVDLVLRDPCLANARTAVAVRDLRAGTAFVARGVDLPLAPASNQKILTASACLSLLGPEHELRTVVRGEHAVDSDGDVGTLYIIGGGDPALDVEGLYSIARAVAALGVRRVTGIVADDSLFAGPGRAPSWPERNFQSWYSAPCSALCTNYNVVAVHALAPKGEAPRVWLDPFPASFDLQGSLRSGRGTWSVRTLAFDPAEEGQRFVVSGALSPGRSARELRSVEDPALFAAHGLAESLGRVGVTVMGSVTRGVTPSGTVFLHARPSPPLSVLVRSMNKISSNVFAETLLRMLGAEILGPPGTREKGLAVLGAFLAAASPSGVPVCVLEDGSGLSPLNRLTATTLTDLLISAAADRTSWPEVLASLPLGGADGTLRKRLAGSPAERLVRAKTGRINSVVALSGIARVDDERDAAFSILVNDFTCPSWKVQDKVDALAIAIVGDAPLAPKPGSQLDLRALRQTWQTSAAHVVVDETGAENGQEQDEFIAGEEAEPGER